MSSPPYTGPSHPAPRYNATATSSGPSHASQHQHRHEHRAPMQPPAHPPHQHHHGNHQHRHAAPSPSSAVPQRQPHDHHHQQHHHHQHHHQHSAPYDPPRADDRHYAAQGGHSARVNAEPSSSVAYTHGGSSFGRSGAGQHQSQQGGYQEQHTTTAAQHSSHSGSGGQHHQDHPQRAQHHHHHAAHQQHAAGPTGHAAAPSDAHFQSPRDQQNFSPHEQNQPQYRPQQNQPPHHAHAQQQQQHHQHQQHQHQQHQQQHQQSHQPNDQPSYGPGRSGPPGQYDHPISRDPQPQHSAAPYQQPQHAQLQHHQHQQHQQHHQQQPHQQQSQAREPSVMSSYAIGHSRAASVAQPMPQTTGGASMHAPAFHRPPHRHHHHHHHQSMHNANPNAAAAAVAMPAPLVGVTIGSSSAALAAVTPDTNARVGLGVRSRGFVLLPPALFGSWHKAPPNPAFGKGGVALEDLQKEDFKFFCDPCQKGFNSKRLYETHMEDHIYCEFPGCRFTCRKGKEWKMELHVASLHNRPDAPNLADTEGYIRSRRSRFPTVETVQTKVEELYYKASRGELLPDERRRWLKQHGVFVSRKWYLPVMREGDATLEESRRRRAEKRLRDHQNHLNAAKNAGTAAATAAEAEEGQQQRPPQPSAEVIGDGAAAAAAADDDDGAPALTEDVTPAAAAAAVIPSAASQAAAGSGADPEGLARYARRPGERMLPLGPNGRYTKSQLVQMVRERYENANRAPAYYVCNRCGEKGHWVEACPKAKDASFDIESRWADGAKPPPGTDGAAAADEDGTDLPATADAGRPADADADADAADGSDANGDGGGLEEVSAKAADVDPAMRALAEERRRINAPALEARLAAVSQRSARRAATAALEEGAPDSEAFIAAANRRARMRRMPTAPQRATLWDRLTEDQRMNEHSVLLQAIRFFTHHRFFDAADAAAPAARSADAASAGQDEAAAADDVEV